MVDAVDAVEVEVALGEVDPHDVEPARVVFLLARVVVVGERVDGDDAVSTAAQRFREVRADETRGTGYDVSHFFATIA